MGEGCPKQAETLCCDVPNKERVPKSGFWHFNRGLSSPLGVTWVRPRPWIVCSLKSLSLLFSKSDKKLFNWYASLSCHHHQHHFHLCEEDAVFFNYFYLEDSAIFVRLMTGCLNIVQWTIQKKSYLLKFTCNEWSLFETVCHLIRLPISIWIPVNLVDLRLRKIKILSPELKLFSYLNF